MPLHQHILTALSLDDYSGVALTKFREDMDKLIHVELAALYQCRILVVHDDADSLNASIASEFLHDQFCVVSEYKLPLAPHTICLKKNADQTWALVDKQDKNLVLNTRVEVLGLNEIKEIRKNYLLNHQKNENFTEGRCVYDLAKWYKEHDQETDTGSPDIAVQKKLFEQRIIYAMAKLLSEKDAAQDKVKIKERAIELVFASQWFSSSDAEKNTSITIAFLTNYARIFDFKIELDENNNIISVDKQQLPHLKLRELFALINDKLALQRDPGKQTKNKTDFDYAQHFLELSTITTQEDFNQWVLRAPNYQLGQYAAAVKAFSFNLLEKKENKSALATMKQVINKSIEDHAHKKKYENHSNNNNTLSGPSLVNWSMTSKNSTNTTYPKGTIMSLHKIILATANIPYISSSALKSNVSSITSTIQPKIFQGSMNAQVASNSRKLIEFFGNYPVQTTEPTKTNIANERLLLEQRIAYELMEALSTASNLKSIETKITELWQAYNLYYSRDDLIRASDLTKIFENIYAQLDLKFKCPLNNYAVSDLYGCIIDKLIQNRPGEQGKVDLEYAQHFLELQSVQTDQQLSAWKARAPGVNFNSSFTDFKLLKGEYKSKTGNMTWDIVQENQILLKQQFAIIENFSKKHSLHPNPSSSSSSSNNNNSTEKSALK